MATESTQKPSLQVDHREKTSGILEALSAYEDEFHVETHRLKTGDYLLNNQILIERKRLHDFIESIKTGRLFQQAYKMVYSNYHPFIILEGNKKEIRTSQMKREAIQGTLIHLTVFLGIPIVRSANITETAQLIRFTASQLYEGNRPGMHASIVKYPRFQLNKNQKVALRILGNFPGIGPEKGMAILSAFKSLKKVFNASQDQLESINGIGPKLADTIYGLINEPFVDQDTITIKPNKR